MRIIGLDLGERRIGVAAAEAETRIAIPVSTLSVDGDPVEPIVGLVDEQRADELVVGLPISMSGAIGTQAQRVLSIVEALEGRLSIPVRTWDERLTSVQAGRGGGRGSARAGRLQSSESRDAIAAAILLQAYLDGSRELDR